MKTRLKPMTLLATGFTIVGITLSGCSSPLTLSEAESTLRQAHLTCEGKVLRSEQIEPDLLVSAQEDSVYLSYWVEDGKNKAIVECVSNVLFGSDLTERELTRDEWISIESRFNFDSSKSNRQFDSRWLENWHETFGFLRSELPGISKRNYIFFWGYSDQE